MIPKTPKKLRQSNDEKSWSRDGLRMKILKTGRKKNTNTLDKTLGRGSVVLSQSPADSQYPILTLLQDVSSCGNTQGMWPLLFSVWQAPGWRSFVCLMCDKLQAWQKLIRATLNSPFWVSPCKGKQSLVLWLLSFKGQHWHLLGCDCGSYPNTEMASTSALPKSFALSDVGKSPKSNTNLNFKLISSVAICLSFNNHKNLLLALYKHFIWLSMII